MFYELRQYEILPGKMEQWIECMETQIIPFQVACGMVITSSFRGETDDSIYVWMRRFESEEQCKALYAKVYESDRWKNEIRPTVMECLDAKSVQVTRLVPTPLSNAQ